VCVVWHGFKLSHLLIVVYDLMYRLPLWIRCCIIITGSDTICSCHHSLRIVSLHCNANCCFDSFVSCRTVCVVMLLTYRLHWSVCVVMLLTYRLRWSVCVVMLLTYRLHWSVCVVMLLTYRLHWSVCVVMLVFKVFTF